MVYLIILFLIKWPFGVIPHFQTHPYIMVPVSYGFVNHTWNGILWQDKPADRLIILGTINLCVRVSGWVGCPKIVGSRSFSPWTLKDPYIYIIKFIIIYIYIPHIFPYIPPFSDQPLHACSKVCFIHAASPKGSAPLRRKKRHHWASWARGCRWDHLKPWGTSCWNSARNGSGKTLQSTPVCITCLGWNCKWFSWERL